MKIFSKLDKAQINYCVIRNRNGIKMSKDIDIFVKANHFPKMKRILIQNDFRQIYSGPIPGHQVFYTYSSGKFTTLDVQAGGLTHNGIVYLPEEYLLPKMTTDAYVLGLVLHSIIDKGYFKSEYKKEIETVSRKLCTELLGQNLGMEIAELIEKRAFGKLLKHKRRLILKSITNKPKGVLAFIEIYTVRVKKLANPFWAGPLVVCIGPDGSGKSSAAGGAAKALARATIRSKTVYMGWRGSILPFISTAMKADSTVFKKSTETREVTGNSAGLSLRSIAVTALYTFELWLRYLIKILPARKTGVTVFCDRYYYDRLALDNHLPQFFQSVLWLIIPKPSVTFLFTAKGETLALRERNLPKENLKKQRARYLALNKTLKAIVINTDQKNKKAAVDLVTKTLWHKKIIG